MVKPAVAVKKSVTPDYIVCLEDGKKFKSLKRHLRTQYNMTPEQYREQWALPPDYPMVDVLPVGVIPPNPTELIMRDRFDQMIRELKNEYDYIVIDSAPVGAVSDTFLIDRMADLTLYICRAGYTDKRNIEFVNTIKKEKTLKKIYFVVNDVDLDVSRYSYHRKYGYGYGYGKKYGYGYGHKKNEI